MSGNVFVPTTVSGFPRDSVVDVTAVITIDRVCLEPPVGLRSLDLVRQVDQGLRLVLEL
jgi:mRNA interferase MazF